MVEGRAEATTLQIVFPVATRSCNVELLERISDKSVKRVLLEDGGKSGGGSSFPPTFGHR